jgi:hypothetical protein
MATMATRLCRPRVRPTWHAGLRRGRERKSTMEHLRQHPEDYQRLLRIVAEIRAQGFEPVPMDRVKQFFDYDRR